MRYGGVRERLNRTVLKTVKVEISSWVRIPPPPQEIENPFAEPKITVRDLTAIVVDPRDQPTGLVKLIGRELFSTKSILSNI